MINIMKIQSGIQNTTSNFHASGTDQSHSFAILWVFTSKVFTTLKADNDCFIRIMLLVNSNLLAVERNHGTQE